jgi:hypothetical protein
MPLSSGAVRGAQNICVDLDAGMGAGMPWKYREGPRTDPRESRWCEQRGYFIDLVACEARSKIRRACRRCIAKWQQLSFPFMDT